MLAPPARVLRIAQRAAELSPEQKTFNRQIRQIEKLRARLAEWEGASARYREKYLRDLAPLHARTTDLQVELVHALDAGSGHKALTTEQRRKLGRAISELAAAILAERDDAAIKAIYNKHNPVDYDTEEAEHAEGVKTFLEDMFDLDLGETDEHDSVDDLFARAKAQFHEKHEAERRAHEEQRSGRKKTAREIKREARAEAAAQQMSQSVREIYRKLVSELHPDRETDPQERARKTELMQRINQAYAKRNLLQLLELQLELEHIDERYIAGLSTARLNHFNVVLKEQIAELKQELMMVEARFCEQFGLSPFEELDPRTLVRDIDYEVFSTERLHRTLQAEIDQVAEVKGLKAWLRTSGKTRKRRGAFDDSF